MDPLSKAWPVADVDSSSRTNPALRSAPTRKGAANYTCPRYLATSAMRIGSAYSAFQGLSDIGFVAICDRFITDGKRDAMHAQIKAYFSAVSV